MNSFKVMIVVCSVMATVCSGQYTQSGKPNSWMNQPASSHLVPNKTGSEDASAIGSSAAPTAPSAPIHVNFPASAFPTISQHLCTCTAVSESTAAGMIEKYQQPSTSAAPEQQAAPAQQSYSQQQAPAQSGSYLTTVAPIEQGPSAADQFVKPTYAMSNKVTGY